MRKVKRSVALLLVVCYLFTGTVFAEGDIASKDTGLEKNLLEEPVSGETPPKEAVPEGPIAEGILPGSVSPEKSLAGDEDIQQSDSMNEPAADTKQNGNKNETVEGVQPDFSEKKTGKEDAVLEELQENVMEGQTAVDGSGAELEEENVESDLTKPEISLIEVDESNKENGKIRILIHDVTSNELVEHILVSVWSDMNGQDDLKEYEAEYDGVGNYIVDLDIKDHNYSYGKYIINAYIRERSGEQYLAGESEFEIEWNPGKVTLEETKDGFNIYLTDVEIPGGEREILFPVWEKGDGQNDVTWYSATEIEDGRYFCSVRFKNYKGMNAYSLDVYARNKSDILCFLEQGPYKTDGSVIGNDIEIENVNRSQGTFRVKVAGATDASPCIIKVPVWSKADQSDIVWYRGERTWYGDYLVNVDISNHQYNAGVYNVHCYREDADGVNHWVGGSSCDMQMGYSSIEAVDTDGTESAYSLQVKGLEVPGGANEVLFAVWGDQNGQNDLTWHQADWWGDGTYGANAYIAEHQEAGIYRVHAYAKNRYDIMQYIGETAFEVGQLPMSAGLAVTNIDGNRGTFTVTMSGVFAPSGISRVQIPMWCADDQSDICWYDAWQVGEGMYAVEMNVANHQFHFGDYKVNAYLTMGNGIRVYAGSTVANISPSNYIYSQSISSTQTEVWMLGVWGERVQFPTWSNEYGQDDIVWYEGTNHGWCNWSVVVDSANHNSGGDFTTHAYVTENGNTYFAGETGYYLEQMPEEARYMHLMANMYSSPTPYFIAVDTGAHRVGIFQGMQGSWKLVNLWDCGDGAPSTPTVKGVFSVGSRGYYFNSGAYRCYWWTQFYNDYLFHSVLYDWNGVLQDGRVGMGLSHGCVRLEIDNAKWIYDTIPSGTTVVVY